MPQESFNTNSGNQPRTKLKNGQLLEGRQKGVDTTGKRAQKQKTHKLPLNTCTRAKEHTKLTLSTHDGAKSTLSTQAPPRLMRLGQRAYKTHPTHTR
jgi:hypothetical protein